MANQRHVAIFQARSPFGLTPTQFSAMVKLAELGVCPQNELGRRTKMDAATIKGVVDRLLEKGLVRVNGDPADRRRKLVALSDSGSAAVPDLHRFGAKVSEATLEPLSAEERPALLRLVGLLT